jgi:VIT1/CCC1 family predicted Fe2+/Mn2+ transporter
MAEKSSIVLRNFVFGVEDSLVSTVGLLSGIASAGVSRETIFLTGLILVLVEALSMAVGSFLSETSVQEYHKKEGATPKHPFLGGVIMFVSYVVAGLVPLLPYIFVEGDVALKSSVLATLAVLFLLGAVSGRISRVSVLMSGFRMVLLGGAAIVVGMTVGNLLKSRVLCFCSLRAYFLSQNSS